MSGPEIRASGDDRYDLAVPAWFRMIERQQAAQWRAVLALVRMLTDEFDESGKGRRR
jgi:hypothetical protein